LLNLQNSEDFSNVAATGSASFPASGGSTADAALSTATIHYDLASDSYTITTSGRTQTFSPSDFSAADSNQFIDVFIKTNGSVTDSLTLTRPGTSGPLTYEFVGGAFWQRTDTGSSTTSGSLEAIAYGVATPDMSVPRTGRAEYSVDMLGVEATFGGIFGIAGTGVTQVDFAEGVLVTHGVSTLSISGSSRFSSEARLSSTENSFAGVFRFTDFNQFNGNLQGQFFGPAAQEIGAAFHGVAVTGDVVVGALIGRGATENTTNASVKTPTVNEFFLGDAGRLVATLDGSSGFNTTGTGFSASDATPDALIVNYDASSDAYTLIAPDRSQYFLGSLNTGAKTESLLLTTPANTLDGFAYPTFSNLQSVATQQWFVGVSSNNQTQYTIEPLVYGIRTPDSALPRTGSGDYVIGMSGTAADDDFINLTNFTGFGFLNADFAAGDLTIEGQVRYLEDYILAGIRPRGEASGTFAGSGQISSTANSFIGPISFSGIGDYSGQMVGHFFGPAGEEVGASFHAADDAGGSLVGTFAGGLDAVASQGFPAIAELTAPTSFPFYGTHDAPNGPLGLNNVVGVSYDPGAGAYTLSLTDTSLLGAPVFDVELNAANRDDAASTASYTFYSVTFNGNPYTAVVLDAVPTNPTIALRYTSLAQLIGTTTPNPLLPSDRHYVAFGLRTPSVRMPIGGSATYNGVAVGTGSVTTNAFSGGSPPSITTFYELSGTTSMTVNFAIGAGSFQSTLDLVGQDILSTDTFVFPTLTFDGSLTGATFSTQQNGRSYGGAFFGPDAEEIGGLFDYFQSDSEGTLTDLEGAFVGKK
jgi:hypothetical protein